VRKVPFLFFFLSMVFLFSFPFLSFGREKEAAETPALAKQDLNEKENFLDLFPVIFFQNTPFKNASQNLNPLPNSFPPSTGIQSPLPAGYDDEETLANFCRSSLQNGSSIEERLSACPRIKNKMIWETPVGGQSPYSEWPLARKERLNEIFQRLMRNEANLGLHCPDPALNMSLTGSMYLTQEQASDIYLAHLAHALYLEITNALPWSILQLPSLQLKELFASKSYHSRILPTLSQAYPPPIQADRDFQLPFRAGSDGLVCDPRVAYRFLRGETSSSHASLIGVSPLETVKNITLWFRDNVKHGDSSHRGRTAVAQYAYLEDRLRARNFEGWRVIIAAFGCHSASHIFYDLAKGVNIPLLNVATEFNLGSEDFRTVNHRGLIFGGGSPSPLILHHLDDIYAMDFSPLSFPIASDGRPLDTSQANQQYFETHWVNPRILESWGFQFLNTLPLVQPGGEYGVVSDPSRNDEDDFGRMAGFWTHNESPARQASQNYFAEKSYETCSWNLIDDYCNLSFPAFLLTLQNRRGEGGSYRPPILRSPLDFYNRAAQCVNAYGGCDAVGHRYQTWESSLGSNVGMEP